MTRTMEAASTDVVVGLAGRDNRTDPRLSAALGASVTLSQANYPVDANGAL